MPPRPARTVPGTAPGGGPYSHRGAVRPARTRWPAPLPRCTGRSPAGTPTPCACKERHLHSSRLPAQAAETPAPCAAKARAAGARSPGRPGPLARARPTTESARRIRCRPARPLRANQRRSRLRSQRIRAIVSGGSSPGTRTASRIIPVPLMTTWMTTPMGAAPRSKQAGH